MAIAIMGPTAVGKSDLAEALAAELDCRIVNADAFQIYKGCDIGTAKPVHRERYELIDICEPTESFSAGRFVELATPLVSNRTSVICGGTGLYVRALFEGYSEMQSVDADVRQAVRNRLEEIGAHALAAEHGISDTAVIRNPIRLARAVEKHLVGRQTRPPVEGWSYGSEPPPEGGWRDKGEFGVRKLKFGLDLPRGELSKRIEQRVQNMVHNGFLREVEGLLRRGVPRECPAFRAIGYRDMADVGAGIATLDEAVERTVTRTRQYAKRQMTWLRKEPGLRWMDATASPGENVSRILKLIAEE